MDLCRRGKTSFFWHKSNILILLSFLYCSNIKVSSRLSGGKVTKCKADSSFTLCNAEHAALELYTLLNTFTLSDALCITITHTQPCIRPWVDFYVHVNVGRSGSRWQLNSWDGPPSLRPAICLSWQTEIRPRRDEWEPSEGAQVSGRCEKICPGHSDLTEFPMFSTAVRF